ERKAIIDDISGVTRDRIYGFSDWNGKNFTVVDTGGFVKGSDDIFEAAIRRQVQIAIEEAAAIIFLVDVTTGITDLDEEIARMLRKNPKRVILAVNKVDNAQRQMLANEFWSLGFDDTIFISSISGGGTGDLLDVVADILPENVSDEANTQDDTIPKIAIVGQPNVVHEKQRIFKTIELALEVNANRIQKIKTSVLNDIMLEIIERTPPPAHR
ncbi:unnamed protein product, partial [Darwinula stevensoni]